MMHWGLTALALAAPALAQPAPTAAGVFTIAGERFAAGDILDARAMPDIAGGAGIMISFAPAAAKRLAALTAAQIDKPVALALDGKVLAEPVVREAIEGGVLQISGDFTVAQAEALAKRISGKDPLPEEFEE